MSNVTPGWYTDTSMPGTQRYWDGNAWTQHVAPIGPPPTAYQRPSYSTRTDGFSIAALVLGIIGILITLIPLVGLFFGIGFDVLAVIFGIIGYNIARRRGSGSGMASVGFTLGLLAIVGMFFGAGTLW